MVTHSGRVSSAALAATEALRVKQAEFIGKKLIKSKKYCLISDSRLKTKTKTNSCPLVERDHKERGIMGPINRNEWLKYTHSHFFQSQFTV